MPKGGLNPEWKGTVTPTNGYHPILSAAIFSSKTRTGKGATMDVNTGEFVNADNPSSDTYLVGKEPDTKGTPVDTVPVADDATMFTSFPKLARDIKVATGSREGSSIGSWRNEDGSIDIDASAQEPNLNKALLKAGDRNEKAIWSTKKFRASKVAYAKKHGIAYEDVEAHADKHNNYIDGDITNPNYKAE